MTRELPIVSVVIPTYDSDRTIRKCLESITYQDYEGDIEVIVVDNLSTDETARIAKRFATRLVQQSCSMPAARNIGANLATGQYIVNLDSDMYLSKSVIRECVEASLQDERIVAVYMPLKIIGSGFCQRSWILKEASTTELASSHEDSSKLQCSG